MKLPWTTRAQKIAALNASLANAQQAFHLPTKSDRHLNIRISRNTSIAIVISLIIHAVILFFVLPQLIKPNSVFPPPQALTITLNKPQPQKNPEPETKPEPPKPEPKHQKIVKKVTPPVIATQKPQSNNQFQVPTKQPEPPKPTPADQPVDMMALVNANRQRRQSEEQSATAKERGTPNEDQRDAVIKRNLAQEGTNGIFQVRDVGLHTAQLSFKGWKNNYNNARLEIFDVQAKPGETIELAIVRKMIVIIRKDYSGDFEWESQRLGHSITKSARIEDTAELEQFLMREMFQNHGFR
jgi:type IV secretory pathway VirB10-like protein